VEQNVLQNPLFLSKRKKWSKIIHLKIKIIRKPLKVDFAALFAALFTFTYKK
jgi:hypothetical protein